VSFIVGGKIMDQNFTKFAFTESVKQVQAKYGSRKSYARLEGSGDRYVLTDREIPFIESRDSFFMATVGENGWPYVQFKGGPKGVLKIIDNRTLAIADFRGNRQYISVGNFNFSNKTCLFLIDYPLQQRLKIWAEADILEASEHPALLAQLSSPGYKAVNERIIIFNIQAYDWNCPQHIMPRFTAEEIRQGLISLDPELVRACRPDDE
jgi:predicted pyridoxine 5'-phosphate oxidase superfamily flavin-nucleotide-binding protein